MIYINSTLAALLLTGFLTVYLFISKYFTRNTKPYRINETETEEDAPPVDNNESKSVEKAVPTSAPYYDRKQSVIIPIIFFIISLMINYLIYTYTVVMKEKPMPFLFVKMTIMNGIIGCAALTDHKRNKIPNVIILFGLALRIIIYFLEFIFERDTFAATLKNDGLGFLIGFVMLFVIAVITKGGIGFGDVKLFGLLGIMAGSGGTFITLFLSLALSSVTALILIAIKKKTIKSKMPMAPFIYAGYVMVCVIGLF